MITLIIFGEGCIPWNSFMQFSPASCYFLSLRPTYLAQHTILKHSQPICEGMTHVLIYLLYLSVKLPHVSYDVEKEATVVSTEKRNKLQVYNTPVATTYAIFDE
jgi:hypothetical protein